MRGRKLLLALKEFTANAEAARLWPGTASATARLKSVMNLEGCVEGARPGRHANFQLFTHQARRSVRQQLNYWKEWASQAKEECNRDSRQEGGRIARMWFLRVGLGPPDVALRTVSTFCRDFGGVEEKTISYEYVARVPDAFAEVLKSLNRRESVLLLLSRARRGVYADPVIRCALRQ